MIFNTSDEEEVDDEPQNGTATKQNGAYSYYRKLAINQYDLLQLFGSSDEDEEELPDNVEASSSEEEEQNVPDPPPPAVLGSIIKAPSFQTVNSHARNNQVFKRRVASGSSFRMAPGPLSMSNLSVISSSVVTEAHTPKTASLAQSSVARRYRSNIAREYPLAESNDSFCTASNEVSVLAGRQEEEDDRVEDSFTGRNKRSNKNLGGMVVTVESCIEYLDPNDGCKSVIKSAIPARIPPTQNQRTNVRPELTNHSRRQNEQVDGRKTWDTTNQTTKKLKGSHPNHELHQGDSSLSNAVSVYNFSDNSASQQNDLQLHNTLEVQKNTVLNEPVASENVRGGGRTSSKYSNNMFFHHQDFAAPSSSSSLEIGLGQAGPKITSVNGENLNYSVQPQRPSKHNRKTGNIPVTTSNEAPPGSDNAAKYTSEISRMMATVEMCLGILDNNPTCDNDSEIKSPVAPSMPPVQNQDGFQTRLESQHSHLNTPYNDEVLCTNKYTSRDMASPKNSVRNRQPRESDAPLILESSSIRNDSVGRSYATEFSESRQLVDKNTTDVAQNVDKRGNSSTSAGILLKRHQNFVDTPMERDREDIQEAIVVDNVVSLSRNSSIIFSTSNVQSVAKASTTNNQTITKDLSRMMESVNNCLSLIDNFSNKSEHSALPSLVSQNRPRMENPSQTQCRNVPSSNEDRASDKSSYFSIEHKENSVQSNSSLECDHAGCAATLNQSSCNGTLEDKSLTSMTTVNVGALVENYLGLIEKHSHETTPSCYHSVMNAALSTATSRKRPTTKLHLKHSCSHATDTSSHFSSKRKGNSVQSNPSLVCEHEECAATLNQPSYPGTLEDEITISNANNDGVSDFSEQPPHVFRKQTAGKIHSPKSYVDIPVEQNNSTTFETKGNIKAPHNKVNEKIDVNSFKSYIGINKINPEDDHVSLGSGKESAIKGNLQLCTVQHCCSVEQHTSAQHCFFSNQTKESQNEQRHHEHTTEPRAVITRFGDKSTSSLATGKREQASPNDYSLLSQAASRTNRTSETKHAETLKKKKIVNKTDADGRSASSHDRRQNLTAKSHAFTLGISKSDHELYKSKNRRVNQQLVAYERVTTAIPTFSDHRVFKTDFQSFQSCSEAIENIKLHKDMVDKLNILIRLYNQPKSCSNNYVTVVSSCDKLTDDNSVQSSHSTETVSIGVKSELSADNASHKAERIWKEESRTSIMSSKQLFSNFLAALKFSTTSLELKQPKSPLQELMSCFHQSATPNCNRNEMFKINKEINFDTTATIEEFKGNSNIFDSTISSILRSNKMLSTNRSSETTYDHPFEFYLKNLLETSSNQAHGNNIDKKSSSDLSETSVGDLFAEYLKCPKLILDENNNNDKNHFAKGEMEEMLQGYTTEEKDFIKALFERIETINITSLSQDDLQSEERRSFILKQLLDNISSEDIFSSQENLSVEDSVSLEGNFLKEEHFPSEVSEYVITENYSKITQDSSKQTMKEKCDLSKLEDDYLFEEVFENGEEEHDLLADVLKELNLKYKNEDKLVEESSTNDPTITPKYSKISQKISPEKDSECSLTKVSVREIRNNKVFTTCQESHENEQKYVLEKVCMDKAVTVNEISDKMDSKINQESHENEQIYVLEKVCMDKEVTVSEISDKMDSKINQESHENEQNYVLEKVCMKEELCVREIYDKLDSKTSQESNENVEKVGTEEVCLKEDASISETKCKIDYKISQENRENYQRDDILDGVSLEEIFVFETTLSKDDDIYQENYQKEENVIIPEVVSENDKTIGIEKCISKTASFSSKIIHEDVNDKEEVVEENERKYPTPYKSNVHLEASNVSKDQHNFATSLTDCNRYSVNDFMSCIESSSEQSLAEEVPEVINKSSRDTIQYYEYIKCPSLLSSLSFKMFNTVKATENSFRAYKIEQIVNNNSLEKSAFRECSDSEQDPVYDSSSEERIQSKEIKQENHQRINDMMNHEFDVIFTNCTNEQSGILIKKCSKSDKTKNDSEENVRIEGINGAVKDCLKEVHRAHKDMQKEYHSDCSSESERDQITIDEQRSAITLGTILENYGNTEYDVNSTFMESETAPSSVMTQSTASRTTFVMENKELDENSSYHDIQILINDRKRSRVSRKTVVMELNKELDENYLVPESEIASSNDITKYIASRTTAVKQQNKDLDGNTSYPESEISSNYSYSASPKKFRIQNKDLDENSSVLESEISPEDSKTYNASRKAFRIQNKELDENSSVMVSEIASNDSKTSITTRKTFVIQNKKAYIEDRLEEINQQFGNEEPSCEESDLESEVYQFEHISGSEPESIDSEILERTKYPIRVKHNTNPNDVSQKHDTDEEFFEHFSASNTHIESKISQETSQYSGREKKDSKPYKNGRVDSIASHKNCKNKKTGSILQNFKLESNKSIEQYSEISLRSYEEEEDISVIEIVTNDEVNSQISHNRYQNVQSNAFLGAMLQNVRRKHDKKLVRNDQSVVGEKGSQLLQKNDQPKIRNEILTDDFGDVYQMNKNKQKASFSADNFIRAKTDLVGNLSDIPQENYRNEQNNDFLKAVTQENQDEGKSERNLEVATTNTSPEPRVTTENCFPVEQYDDFLEDILDAVQHKFEKENGGFHFSGFPEINKLLKSDHCVETSQEKEELFKTILDKEQQPYQNKFFEDCSTSSAVINMQKCSKPLQKSHDQKDEESFLINGSSCDLSNKNNFKDSQKQHQNISIDINLGDGPHSETNLSIGDSSKITQESNEKVTKKDSFVEIAVSEVDSNGRVIYTSSQKSYINKQKETGSLKSALEAVQYEYENVLNESGEEYSVLRDALTEVLQGFENNHDKVSHESSITRFTEIEGKIDSKDSQNQHQSMPLPSKSCFKDSQKEYQNLSNDITSDDIHRNKESLSVGDSSKVTQDTNEELSKSMSYEEIAVSEVDSNCRISYTSSQKYYINKQKDVGSLKSAMEAVEHKYENILNKKDKEYSLLKDPFAEALQVYENNHDVISHQSSITISTEMENTTDSKYSQKHQQNMPNDSKVDDASQSEKCVSIGYSSKVTQDINEELSKNMPYEEIAVSEVGSNFGISYPSSQKSHLNKQKDDMSLKSAMEAVQHKYDNILNENDKEYSLFRDTLAEALKGFGNNHDIISFSQESLMTLFTEIDSNINSKNSQTHHQNMPVVNKSYSKDSQRQQQKMPLITKSYSKDSQKQQQKMPLITKSYSKNSQKQYQNISNDIVLDNVPQIEESISIEESLSTGENLSTEESSKITEESNKNLSKKCSFEEIAVSEVDSNCRVSYPPSHKSYLNKQKATGSLKSALEAVQYKYDNKLSEEYSNLRDELLEALQGFGNNHDIISFSQESLMTHLTEIDSNINSKNSQTHHQNMPVVNKSYSKDSQRRQQQKTPLINKSYSKDSHKQYNKKWNDNHLEENPQSDDIQSIGKYSKITQEKLFDEISISEIASDSSINCMTLQETLQVKKKYDTSKDRFESVKPEKKQTKTVKHEPKVSQEKQFDEISISEIASNSSINCMTLQETLQVKKNYDTSKDRFKSVEPEKKQTKTVKHEPKVSQEKQFDEISISEIASNSRINYQTLQETLLVKKKYDTLKDLLDSVQREKKQAKSLQDERKYTLLQDTLKIELRELEKNSNIFHLITEVSSQMNQQISEKTEESDSCCSDVDAAVSDVESCTALGIEPAKVSSERSYVSEITIDILRSASTLAGGKKKKVRLPTNLPTTTAIAKISAISLMSLKSVATVSKSSTSSAKRNRTVGNYFGQHLAFEVVNGLIQPPGFFNELVQRGAVKITCEIGIFYVTGYLMGKLFQL